MTSNDILSNVLFTKEEVFKLMDIGQNDLVPGYNTPEDIFRSQFTDEDLETLKLFNLSLDDVSRLEDVYLVSKAYPAGFLTILSETNLLEGRSNVDIKDFTYGNVPSKSNFAVPCIRKETWGRHHSFDGHRENTERYSNKYRSYRGRDSNIDGSFENEVENNSPYMSRPYSKGLKNNGNFYANSNNYSANSRLRRENRNHAKFSENNSFKSGSGSDENSPTMYGVRSPNERLKSDGRSSNMYSPRSPNEKYRTDRLAQSTKSATVLLPVSSNTTGYYQTTNRSPGVHSLTDVEGVSSRGFRPVRTSQTNESSVVLRISPLKEVKTVPPVQDRVDTRSVIVQPLKPVPVNNEWTESVLQLSPLLTNTEGYKTIVQSELISTNNARGTPVAQPSPLITSTEGYKPIVQSELISTNNAKGTPVAQPSPLITSPEGYRPIVQSELISANNANGTPVAQPSPLITSTEGYKPSVVPSELVPISNIRGRTNSTGESPDYAGRENCVDQHLGSYDVVFGDRDDQVYYVRKKCDQSIIDEMSRILRNEELIPWSLNPKEKVVVEVNCNFYRARERTHREENAFHFKLVDVGWLVRIDASDVRTRVFQLPAHMVSLAKPICFSIVLNESEENRVVLKHSVASIREEGVQDGGKKVVRVVKMHDDFQFAPIATPNVLKLDERVLVVSSSNHKDDLHKTGCMWVVLQRFVDQYKEWVPLMKQMVIPLQEPPVIGHFYLFTSSNAWNRVQVVSTQPLKLFHIDKGDLQTVHAPCLKEFRVLPKEMSLVAPFAYRIRFSEPFAHAKFNEPFHIIPITVRDNVYTVLIDESEFDTGDTQQQSTIVAVKQKSVGNAFTQPTVKLNQSLIVTATTQRPTIDVNSTSTKVNPTESVTSTPVYKPTVDINSTLTQVNPIESVISTSNQSGVNRAIVDVNQTSVVASDRSSQPVSNLIQTSSKQPVASSLLTDIDLAGLVTDPIFLPLHQPVQLLCTAEDATNPDVKWMQPVLFDSTHGLSIHEIALDTSKTLIEEKNPTQVGQLCLCEFDGVWCRAKVVCSHPLTVFYIDYGNCDIVENVDQLKAMPEALKCIKPAACKIKFYYSGPPVECFTEYTFTPVYMDEDVHVVLRDGEKEDARLMDRRIMDGQFVQLELGTRIEVFWSQVDDVDATCAWVQAATLFCAHLQDCTNIAQGSTPVKFNRPPRVGELCMKFFDDMFCRARVVSVNPLTVFYIDYGNCEEVDNVDELVQLPPSLHHIVPFAFKIKIPEVKDEYNVPGTDMMFTPIQVVRNLYIGQVTEKL